MQWQVIDQGQGQDVDLKMALNFGSTCPVLTDDFKLSNQHTEKPRIVLVWAR